MDKPSHIGLQPHFPLLQQSLPANKHLIIKSIITLTLLISSLPLFAQDTGTNAAPQIPEEARKHFVMGETMFKEAKRIRCF